MACVTGDGYPIFHVCIFFSSLWQHWKRGPFLPGSHSLAAREREAFSLLLSRLQLIGDEMKFCWFGGSASMVELEISRERKNKNGRLSEEIVQVE